MSMRVIYDYHAVSDLKSLPRKIADRITLKIEWYASQDNPLRFAEFLNPPLKDLYRFRIGEYRAIFEVGANNEMRFLIILRVKHRKNVYE